jgi:hypothetical protein
MNPRLTPHNAKLSVQEPLRHGSSHRKGTVHPPLGMCPFCSHGLEYTITAAEAARLGAVELRHRHLGLVIALRPDVLCGGGDAVQLGHGHALRSAAKAYPRRSCHMVGFASAQLTKTCSSWPPETWSMHAASGDIASRTSGVFASARKD